MNAKSFKLIWKKYNFNSLFMGVECVFKRRAPAAAPGTLKELKYELKTRHVEIYKPHSILSLFIIDVMKVEVKVKSKCLSLDVLV